MGTLKLVSICIDYDTMGVDEQGQVWKFMEENEQYPDHWERLSMVTDPPERKTWPDIKAEKAREKRSIEEGVQMEEEFAAKERKKARANEKERQRRANLGHWERFKEWLEKVEKDFG